MSKIKGLYQNFIKEREKDFKDYVTGGDKMEELQKFLMQKLNAEDYGIAEELLTALIAETEEKGFIAGSKYTASLGKELFTE